DGEDSLDQGGVFGVLESRELEEGMDGGEPRVARPHGVLALLLGMFQKGGNQFGVEVLESEFRRLFACAVPAEGEQHSKGVSVSRQRVGTGGALAAEAVGEEGLQRRSQVAHEVSPPTGSRRSAARARSAGAA